jgi:hypothetical protein
MSDKTDKEAEQISIPLETAPLREDRSTARPPTGKKEALVAPEAALEWVSHPAKKNPRVTVMVTLFIVLLIVIVYYLTYSVWFTVLAFMILYGSLSAFYFPTRYKLTEKEIVVKTTLQTLHKQWSQYRSCYPDKNGILLSPFMRPSRLENFRGLYIRFWNNKDEVTAFVKAQIDKVRTAEGLKGQ